MSDKDLILKLARVIIAVAWADGQITNEEINCLKDLIFKLRQTGFDDTMQLSAREWARLDMYVESPVGAAERARLVADLQNSLRSAEQKQLAIRTLQELVEADGIVSDSEKDVVAEITEAINSAEVGILGGLERLIGGAMQRRSQAVAGAPNREAYFEDFVKNKVYYAVSQRLQIDATELNISDDDLRKLGLAGGLMAKVAQVDREVTDSEFDAMVQAMSTHWNVNQKEAIFVAEVAVSAVDVTYDAFRMMREMTASTTVEERQKFLAVLFAVAEADGQVSYDETEEIRLIARGLNLTHKDFIDAKLASSRR